MSFLAKMESIQKQALKYGGSYVHYSQCIEPTSTLINSLPYTSNGICQALSAKWIAEHANDRSLWSWLFRPGTTIPSLPHIANLMINFTESVVQDKSDIEHVQSDSMRRRIANRISNRTTRSKDTKGEFYQDFVTDKYLKLYANLIRRRIVQESVAGSMGKRIDVGASLGAGYRLADNLHQNKMVSRGGSYVLISIMGNGGHAMAAFTADDFAFFDPNFGEFYFPSHAKFKQFFLQFWKLSGYYRDFPKFYLMPYAKGI